jgi:Purple acid Phosphatase, N-terminal domain/Calcineurin-like phosphoesterase
LNRSISDKASRAVIALVLLGVLVAATLATAPASGQTSTPQLLVSSSPDRSSPVPLAGASVEGDIYVFVAPESGIKKVRFWVDDPQRQGPVFKEEGGAPWDLAGTHKSGVNALPFDASALGDGSHNVTAVVSLSAGGSETLSADFTVGPGGPPQDPSVSLSPGQLSFTLEPGDSASGTLSVGTSNGASPLVSLSDNVPWLSLNPATTSAPGTVTANVDAGGLSNGIHNATITAQATGFQPASIPVSLRVAQTVGVDQVHLAWVGDTSSTMNVVWRTSSQSVPSEVQYRRTGTSTWLSQTGAERPSGTQGKLHEVMLTSLQPSTGYEYRLRSDGGGFSAVLEMRTGPPSGPADFEAIYVADTGIIGRTDGLAAGTEQVIEEIAALDPDFVLLGGDYAYYNTETRFSTLDQAIDAWFNQMQPIGTQAPMMVAYGNHEIKLGEGYEPWAARFPHAPGFGDGRHYSFDVGDVHFVSITAVTDRRGLPNKELNWIEEDIEAAWDNGARWVIPFFHASPFSDGKNHPSNLDLRAQFGPRFEDLGVKIAIASHDQSYERTFPLVNVPASNTRTSTSLSCYEADSDGTTYVKVSPGGKLSNKNENFSKFKTVPAPAYTAFRDNTKHHFLRLRVFDEGIVEVEAFALAGDGSPPFVQDRFEYRLGQCPAAP